MVTLDHLAVADPFEHELVGEDALVVNLESILIELQLNRTIRCSGLLGGCALWLSISTSQVQVGGSLLLLLLVDVHLMEKFVFS